MATANLYSDLFGKLIEGLSPLSISDASENLVISTHYRQYDELVAGLLLDTDENNDGKVADDKVADDRVADDGAADDRVADNRTANNDNDLGEDNNQNSDRHYKKEQRKFGCLRKGFFF